MMLPMVVQLARLPKTPSVRFTAISTMPVVPLTDPAPIDAGMSTGGPSTSAPFTSDHSRYFRTTELPW